MLGNNNQAAVKRLSSRVLRQNKVRNAFAVLAVILTTFMFTSVFSIGYSVAENVNVMMLRQQGTKTTITLKGADSKQIEAAKRAENLFAAGMRISAGRAADTQKKVKFLLDYYDKTEFEENFTPAISDIEGVYPKDKEDIMISLSGLRALGIETPREGMEVRLIKASKECVFRLSGWFTDYGISRRASFQGFVSERYVQSLGLTAEKDGMLCLSAKEGKQRELMEELSFLVTLHEKQEFKSRYDVQGEYNDRAKGLLAVVVFLGAIIIVSGYLLIYNIMYISVTKNIRFYGLLKTIGTSPAQIRQIVKKQVISLCIIGIPIGMLLGAVLSFGLIPVAMRMYAAGSRDILPVDIHFSPFIYVGTVFFAMVTVALSSRKPARLAGRVSPVEALKYNGQNIRMKVKQRNTTDGGKLHKMAYRNVFREKKRAVLVFASLFMGTMAFLAVRTFLNAIHWENFVTSYLPYSISITIHTEYTDNAKQEEKYIQDAERLASDIAKMEGVTYVRANRISDKVSIKFDRELFAPFLEQEGLPAGEKEMLADIYENPESPDEMYSAPVISVDRDTIEKYNLRARQKIDIERFERGEICLLGYVDTIKQSEQMLGKAITLTDQDSGKTIDLEVGACPTRTEHTGMAVGFRWMLGGSPECILVSDNVLQTLCEKTTIATINADCEKAAESQVGAQVDKMVKSSVAASDAKIRSQLAEAFQSMINGINIMGGGLSLILIFIGVINFINVMLTSVLNRRTELAVLESIGMAKGQIKRMLIFEGGFYSIITIFLMLTLGNIMIYAVKNWVLEAVDYAVFQYPAAEGVLLAVLLIIICVAVPSVVYQIFSRESVTERLRSGD